MRRGTSKPEKFDFPGSGDGELQWRMIVLFFWYSFMTFQLKGCRPNSQPSILTAQIPAGCSIILDRPDAVRPGGGLLRILVQGSKVRLQQSYTPILSCGRFTINTIIAAVTLTGVGRVQRFLSGTKTNDAWTNTSRASPESGPEETLQSLTTSLLQARCSAC
jgi:hypothetical protein